MCLFICGEYGRSVANVRGVQQVTSFPGSALVVVLCIGIWARLRTVGLTYADVGLSYDSIQQCQLWRIISSQVSKRAGKACVCGTSASQLHTPVVKLTCPCCIQHNYPSLSSL